MLFGPLSEFILVWRCCFWWVGFETLCHGNLVTASINIFVVWESRPEPSPLLGLLSTQHGHQTLVVFEV